jgi:four helix bundle protein
VTIRRFEDLDSWKQARLLTIKVYGVAKRDPLRSDWALRDQMCRASISVMANIAEGFGRKGKVEFSRFPTIAKASCAELQSHLYIALDLGYVDQDQFKQMFTLATRTELLIAGMIRHLQIP